MNLQKFQIINYKVEFREICKCQKQIKHFEGFDKYD